MIIKLTWKDQSFFRYQLLDQKWSSNHSYSRWFESNFYGNRHYKLNQLEQVWHSCKLLYLQQEYPKYHAIKFNLTPKLLHCFTQT